MKVIDASKTFNLSEVDEDEFWNFGTSGELLLHRIHAYPAKFPHFLIEKAKSYVESQGRKIEVIADVFCGCGTTALEAKKLRTDFWGCDINPIATLITRVKCSYFDEKLISKYTAQIIEDLENGTDYGENALLKNERIKYWFEEDTIQQIHILLSSIYLKVPKSKYRDFFLCATSSILKGTSRWLTKSIKPQLDPNKEPVSVQTALVEQVSKMLKANSEAKRLLKNPAKSKIRTANLLDIRVKKPVADLVITSPPYVTSYEYADLHQLSTLCLGFTDDYKALRDGSIGSLTTYKREFDYGDLLSEDCKTTYEALKKVSSAKANSVAKYFIDLEKATCQIYQLLHTDGYAFFVIGNTKYKDITVDNTSHLIKSMQNSGFSGITITKRKISGKILTPYRDDLGRFTKSSSGRKVYSHEYIIIGKK